MAKNPVVFQNGTLVQKATVEIDGNVYEVEPAQYEGTTPLSAYNLNRLQDNLYDYVDAEVNNLNNNVYVKGNFAVVNGTKIIANRGVTDYLDITLPNGFTRDNTFVIGQKITKITSGGSYIDRDTVFGSTVSTNETQAYPKISFWSSNVIRIYIKSEVANETNTISLLLMKIN